MSNGPILRMNGWLPREGYEVALPITFACGAGVTCSISPEQVRFRTEEKLDVGTQLIGSINLSSAESVTGVLHFRARISRVHPLRASDHFEVEARFEHYELGIA
jgi:hypothetical protein